MNRKFKRVLIKLSGEAMVGSQGYGIDPEVLSYTASEVASVCATGVETGIVIGGGNIFRGLSKNAESMNRVQADQMGMLATMINSIALHNALKNAGIDSVIQSAISIDKIADQVIISKALDHFKNGKVVIFACGTGNPFFTTDTAAVLRAKEIGADIMIKATKVDGIYDSDPVTNAGAKKIRSLSHMEVMKQNLRVLDITAVSFSLENSLRIGVVNLLKKGHLKGFLNGEDVGSVIE